MQPRSEERGEPREQIEILGPRARASMQPRSEERGELPAARPATPRSSASMQPRSEERGESQDGSGCNVGTLALQCSRVLKNAESMINRSVGFLQPVASMQPRSEERGEAVRSPSTFSKTTLQCSRVLKNAERSRLGVAPAMAATDASMQPRSEERGEGPRVGRGRRRLEASMQPRSEERGEKT